MSLWSQYCFPSSVEEALAFLASAPGPARPIAGGTDLLLEIQQGRHAPQHTLVDITRIPELCRLELHQSTLFIGAAVTIRQVTEHPLVEQHAQALLEACRLIGGPQVRNTATLGGNVAHALPAADGTIALLALDAQAEVASRAGRRRLPLADLFKGVGQSALSPTQDLLIGFHLPLKEKHQASAFGRVMNPQGVALPVLNLALWLERRQERIHAIRIAVAPSAPVPQRASALEECLIGAVYSEQAVSQAQALVESSLRFRTSPQRATSAYRYQLCKVLLADLLKCAWQRSLEEGGAL